MYGDLIAGKVAYKKDGVISVAPLNVAMLSSISEKHTIVTIGVWAAHIGITNAVNLYPKCTFGMLGMENLSIEQKVEIIDRLGQKRYEQNEPK